MHQVEVAGGVGVALVERDEEVGGADLDLDAGQGLGRGRIPPCASAASRRP